MDNVFRNFYKSFYLKTGGFIPSKPVNKVIYPGDFFQINNGVMIILGNIFRQSIVAPDDSKIDYGIKLNPANWELSSGISKPYSGRGSGSNPIEGAFEFSKQVLAFAERGSFFFRGNLPESVRIANWLDIKQELIIKLTQTLFSFREVYIATDCATTEDWTLAISDSDRGELEIATDEENFGLVDIFGHSSSRTIQSKEIAYYHREPNRKPSFFRAKKLIVRNEKMDEFISNLISQRTYQNEWASQFFEYDFFNGGESFAPIVSNKLHTLVLDMLQANELNPNTALLYFDWVDANLDDVEKLFLSYGN